MSWEYFLQLLLILFTSHWRMNWYNNGSCPQVFVDMAYILTHATLLLVTTFHNVNVIIWHINKKNFFFLKGSNDIFLCVYVHEDWFKFFNSRDWSAREMTVYSVITLTGYVRDDHMVVSSCFTTAPFSELKAGHLEGIRGLYAENCKCRVRHPVLRHEVH